MSDTPSAEHPESILCPGMIVAQAMERMQMSGAKFAGLVGISEADLYLLIDGAYPISRELATSLAEVTGVSLSFWIASEKFYRHRLAKMREKAEKERAEREACSEK